jgi:hypothetical protein
MKETTDLVMAVISLANGVGQAVADDGKIDVTDTVYLIEFMGSLPAAASGAEKIPGEIENMTDEQRTDLIALVKAKFDIPQDNVEEVLEDALTVAEDLVCLFAKVKDVING